MPPNCDNVRVRLLEPIQTSGYSAGMPAEVPSAVSAAKSFTFPSVDTFSCSSAGASGFPSGCSERWAFSSSFAALFLFGLRGRCCFLGGVFTSTFSWVLLAELAVGRIIRARKPSSAAFGAPVLVRLFVLSGALDGAGREGREVFLLPTFDDAPDGTPREPAIVRFLTSVDGLRPRLLLILARLGDLEGGPPAILAAEAAVGAVAEAGRRTGRVGDRGLGLVGGEMGVVFLLAFALTEDDGCPGFGTAAVDGLVAKEDWRVFSLMDPFDGSLSGLLEDTGCLGDRAGCFGDWVVETGFLPDVLGVLGV